MCNCNQTSGAVMTVLWSDSDVRAEPLPAVYILPPSGEGLHTGEGGGGTQEIGGYTQFTHAGCVCVCGGGGVTHSLPTQEVGWVGTHSLPTQEVGWVGTHSLPTQEVRGTHSLPTLEVRGTHSLPTLEERGTHSLPTQEVWGTHSLATQEVRGTHSLPTLEEGGTHSLPTLEEGGTHSLPTQEVGVAVGGGGAKKPKTPHSRPPVSCSCCFTV